MNETEIGRVAEILWQARVEARPCQAPTSLFPAMTIEEAYRVSRANFRRRLGAGAKAVGAKVGLTSAAVQKQLGVEQPDFGYLTSDMTVLDGGAVPRASLIQAKVEGEVAFILKRDLKGPGVTSEEAAAAVESVAAAVEIIDSRVRDWKILIQDTIADNASSASFVLGAPRPLAGLDLAAAAMILRKNGKVESTGRGTACLGGPLNAVAWLANTLGALGETLRAGEIILSGAYGPVVPFLPGDRCEVSIEGFETVSCSYAP